MWDAMEDESLKSYRLLVALVLIVRWRTQRFAYALFPRRPHIHFSHRKRLVSYFSVSSYCCNDQTPECLSSHRFTVCMKTFSIFQPMPMFRWALFTLTNYWLVVMAFWLEWMMMKISVIWESSNRAWNHIIPASTCTAAARLNNSTLTMPRNEVVASSHFIFVYPWWQIGFLFRWLM